MATRRITVVGGGLAGLVAAIACAESGAEVTLYEAHRRLGGRARSTDGPYITNDGPHALYTDGPHWAWLNARGLVGRAPSPIPKVFLHTRVLARDRLGLGIPPEVLRMAADRRVTAPVDETFRGWAARRYGERTAEMAANAMVVVAYDGDPGRLSAAFVWERLQRVLVGTKPTARYIPGGWSALVDRLAAHARRVGVRIATGERVDHLPDPPVIVATELASARILLGDDSLTWPGGRAALLDVGVENRRGDLALVLGGDEPVFMTRQSFVLPEIAPPGHSTVQLHYGLRPDQPRDHGTARLERVLDLALPGWRRRCHFRRDALAVSRTGALDLPGTTWRDRPAIDRGDGVFLAGDMTAAPGMLCEAALMSGLMAATGAVAAAGVPSSQAV